MSSPNITGQKLQRRPHWVAQVSLTAFVALLAVTIGAGLVIRVGALRPSNVFTLAKINAALAMHSSSALFMSLALLLGFAFQVNPRNRAASRTLLPTSLLAFAFATGAGMSVIQGETTRWLIGEVAFIFTLIGVYAVYAAKSAAKKWSWGVAVTGIAYILTGIGLFGGLMAASRWSLDVLMAGSLATIAQEESGELRSSSRLVLVGVGLSSVARSFSESPVLEFFAFWGALAMAYILVATTWAAIRMRKPQHVWSRRYYILAMITFVQAVLLRALLNAVSIDHHLHDTLFAVGAVHLEYFTPALALLGLAYRNWENNPNRHSLERLAWAGFALLTIGTHVMAWSFVALGRRGMPRRYHGYLEQFQYLHVACTIGAGLLVAGVAVALSVLCRSRSENRVAFNKATT